MSSVIIRHVRYPLSGTAGGARTATVLRRASILTLMLSAWFEFPSTFPLSPTHYPGEQPNVRRLVVDCRLRELPAVLWPAVVKVAIGLRAWLRLDPLDRAASVPVLSPEALVGATHHVAGRRVRLVGR